MSKVCCSSIKNGKRCTRNVLCPGETMCQQHWKLNIKLVDTPPIKMTKKTKQEEEKRLSKYNEVYEEGEDEAEELVLVY
jgi:hypothetical protein